MEILYVSNDKRHAQYNPRSHETRVAEELARMGHTVHLSTFDDPQWPADDEQPDTLDILPATGDQHSSLRWPTNPDVAFTTTPAGAQLLNAPQGPTCPLVGQVLDVPMWRLQFGDEAPWYDQWGSILEHFSTFDHLVYNAQTTQEDYHDALNQYEDLDPDEDVPPGSVVYYGITTETADQVLNAHSESPFDRDGPHYVTVSRMAWWKGYNLALHAAELADLPDGATLHFAGEGRDLQRVLSHAHVLDTKVRFWGGVDDYAKFDLLKHADAGLYLGFNPHITSLFPLEAAYAGTGCLTANTDINREKCQDSVTYVTPHDTKRIAARLEEVAGLVQNGAGFRTADKHRSWVGQERSTISHAQGLSTVFEEVV